MQNKKLTFTVIEAQRKLEQFCIYQDRCHEEVEKKLLQMNMIHEAREVIIMHLITEDFLNEERFSKSYARGKFRIKHWGKQRIIRALRQRNISKYNIETALKEINDDEYFNTLNEIAKRKLNTIQETNPFKRNKKLADYLIYKGYEYQLINEVVNGISKN